LLVLVELNPTSITKNCAELSEVCKPHRWKLLTLCEKLRIMTMTDFDVKAVDLSGLLNTSAEDKAKQVPDPATYHILCMLPKAEEEFSETGILKSATAMYHEELLSPVLFVAKMGPDAFADKARFPSGPSCKVGDFVLVRPNTGTRMKIHGTEWRLINDDSVQAVVQDPRGIQRPN